MFPPRLHSTFQKLIRRTDVSKCQPLRGPVESTHCPRGQPRDMEIRLILDRAHWKRGTQNIYILLLSATWRGVSFLLGSRQTQLPGGLAFGTLLNVQAS